MRAVLTHLIPCTNFKPTRIKAQVPDGSNEGLQETFSYDELQDGSLREEQVHGKAAMRLATRLGWITPTNYLIGGYLKSASYVFVFSDSPIIPEKETDPS